nr:unnamed protein product [Digitaria exilis]
MASCWCREAVNSLILKLTQIMETRPVVRDLLQGLTTDELLQVWKMVLEMAYGIDDWIDPKLVMSLNLVELEADREQIREIQALIVESRARCRSNDRGGAAREAILDVSVGQENMADIAGEDDTEERLDADATIKIPVVVFHFQGWEVGI